MNGWLILLILLVVFVFLLMAISRVLDRRRMNKRTVETLGDGMFKEIDTERTDAVEKAKKFRKVLEEKRRNY